MNIIYDYVFICLLLGNDFVQHTPSINLRYDGLDILLLSYDQLQRKYNGKFQLININSNDLIHLESFIEYIELLSMNEDKRIKNIMNIRFKQEKKMTHILRKSNDSEKISNHKPILNRDNEKIIFNNSKYWNTNYYMYCLFHTEYNPAYESILISKKKELCRLYIESLYWTINYYINGCIAWRWYNPYNIAPFLSDIYKYLLTINTISINKDNIPYKPDEQLKIVLPPSSFSLIKDKPKLPHYYYPIDFKEEYILKRYEWESYPLIPN